jgi:NAD(P)-dependent dehydrogenase (short-subunit alcohol dehydrogenase family)
VVNRVVVITGAGSGIGRATARAFLSEGDRVTLVGRRRDALEETAAGSERAMVCPCDVTDPGSVERTFGEISSLQGRIDVLVNNAGAFSRPALPDEIEVSDWMTIVAVNLTGAYLSARAAFGQMRRQTPQGGRIINNGSVSAHVPRPGSAPYTATKHAITGLTKSLILDGRPYSIATSQLDVGNALTEMTGPMSHGVRQADGSVRPEPVMSADEVARAVLYIASLPPGANIPFMTIMATTMPLLGRG